MGRICDDFTDGDFVQPQSRDSNTDRINRLAGGQVKVSWLRWFSAINRDFKHKFQADLSEGGESKTPEIEHSVDEDGDGGDESSSDDKGMAGLFPGNTVPGTLPLVQVTREESKQHKEETTGDETGLDLDLDIERKARKLQFEEHLNRLTAPSPDPSNGVANALHARSRTSGVSPSRILTHELNRQKRRRGMYIPEFARIYIQQGENLDQLELLLNAEPLSLDPKHIVRFP